MVSGGPGQVRASRGGAGGSAQAEARPYGKSVSRIGLGKLVVAAQQDADEGEEREEAEHGREDRYFW